MNTSIKELSADEIDAVSGGFFFGCFSWNTCAPQPKYEECQPKQDYSCQPKPRDCEPRQRRDRCEPKPSCEPKPGCGDNGNGNGNGGGTSEEM